ncbi:MAG: hypothetical protein RLZ51_947, partial [Pseudomonadota bacterium]
MAVSLDVAATPSLVTILEGATDPAGMTVSALVVDGSITGVNGSLEAIAIERLNTSLGTWQYKLEGTSQWLTIRADLIDSTTNTLALLLGPNDSIRLLPFGDLNGTLSDAIRFRAWDMSSGTAGQYVVTAPVNGGYSSAADTASISVTALNDAPTFSPIAGSGMQTITGISGGRSALVQPDGKILVSGFSSDYVRIDGQYQLVAGFNVSRLNADGTLDASFGNGGTTLVTQTGGTGAYRMALQADGKIVVAGQSNYGSVGLVRLNADGSLDTSFVAAAGAQSWIGLPTVTEVATQANGKLVIAGSLYGPPAFALLRLNADGSLDNSFSEDGLVGLSVSARGLA